MWVPVQFGDDASAAGRTAAAVTAAVLVVAFLSAAPTMSFATTVEKCFHPR